MKYLLIMVYIAVHEINIMVPVHLNLLRTTVQNTNFAPPGTIVTKESVS